MKTIPIKYAQNTAFSLILITACVLSLRELGNSSLGYPDADRILMDGVFLLDFLKDFPINNIYEYTTLYYGQYPALSIGYRPPFFPLIEALFNRVFGINMWSSRLALLTFYVIGITAWYKLIDRLYDWQIAFYSTLLLITTPFIAKWGWYTMAELPVLSLTLLCGYYFYRYMESEKPVFCYATAVVFVLACWTKQTAIFTLLWFIIYAGFEKKLIILLKRKEVWISALIILIFLIPLGILTLWLGKMNISQSIGGDVKEHTISRLSIDNLIYHFKTLYKFHLTLSVLVFSVIGGLLAIFNRDKKLLYPLCLFIATYLFFTYLVGKNERYPIFWIPFFCLLATLPVYYLKSKSLYQLLAGIVFMTIAAYQISLIYKHPVNYATGYDAAAQFVLDNQKVPIVFVDSYNNGYFTYFMRQLDPQKATYVLRADKLLSSSSIASNFWLEIHAHSENDITQLLDDYGVDLIVLDSNDLSGIDIHNKFRTYLQTGPFELIKEIPVVSTRPPLMDQTILIYRYLNQKTGSKTTMTLRLPVIGKTITVPIKNAD